jgi:hypothetical protein
MPPKYETLTVYIKFSRGKWYTRNTTCVALFLATVFIKVFTGQVYNLCGGGGGGGGGYIGLTRSIDSVLSPFFGTYPTTYLPAERVDGCCQHHNSAIQAVRGLLPIPTYGLEGAGARDSLQSVGGRDTIHLVLYLLVPFLTPDPV